MTRQVLLDNQIFTSQIHGGVSRYFAELLKHRDEMGTDLDLRLRLPVTVNQHLTPQTGFTGRQLALPPNQQAARVLRRAIHAFGSLPPRGFRASDVLHHTYYRPEVLRRTHGVRRVSTLHDMIPDRFPEHFPRGNPHLAKQHYLEQSDLIISVSRSSAEEMLDVWPHLSSREVVVVPLGVGDEFLLEGPKYHARTAYLLFVGSRGGYKNFGLVLKALRAAGPRLSHLDLLAAGGGPFTQEEKELISQLGLAERARQLPATDEELAALFRGATAFVFPSLAEGFGLPMLEAMACRCPAVLSDLAVFREVAGDAALFFDPTSAESLAGSLESLDDPDTAASVRVRGRALAETHTWRRTAKATAEAYRQVL